MMHEFPARESLVIGQACRREQTSLKAQHFRPTALQPAGRMTAPQSRPILTSSGDYRTEVGFAHLLRQSQSAAQPISTNPGTNGARPMGAERSHLTPWIPGGRRNRDVLSEVDSGTSPQGISSLLWICLSAIRMVGESLIHASGSVSKSPGRISSVYRVDCAGYPPPGPGKQVHNRVRHILRHTQAYWMAINDTSGSFRTQRFG